MTRVKHAYRYIYIYISVYIGHVQYSQATPDLKTLLKELNMKLGGGPYVPIPLYKEDKSGNGWCLELLMNELFCAPPFTR